MERLEPRAYHVWSRMGLGQWITACVGFGGCGPTSRSDPAHEELIRTLMNLQQLPHRISECSTLRIQSHRKFLEPSINLSLFPLFLKPQIAVSHKRLLFPNFSLLRRRRRRGRWRIRWWRLKKLQLFLRRSILGSSVACNCFLSSNLIQLVFDFFFFFPIWAAFGCSPQQHSHVSLRSFPMEIPLPRPQLLPTQPSVWLGEFRTAVGFTVAKWCF